MRPHPGPSQHTTKAPKRHATAPSTPRVLNDVVESCQNSAPTTPSRPARSDKRAGSAGDEASAAWLREQAFAAGATIVTQDDVQFEKVEVHASRVDLSGGSIAAYPLHNCSYTGADGACCLSKRPH